MEHHWILIFFIKFIVICKGDDLEILYYILLSVFVIVSFLLVLVILMQTSKTGGMGAGIGGNAAMNQAFGVEGADKLLVKITSVLAFIFMAIALSLVKISPVVSSGQPIIEQKSDGPAEDISPDTEDADNSTDDSNVDTNDANLNSESNESTE